MQLILIVAIAIFAYIYFRAKTAHLSEARRKALGKKWLFVGGLVLLALVAFLKGQVILGAFASLFALILRGLPLLRFLPFFAKFFQQAKASTQQQSSVKTVMTKAEAADILGVDENADDETIVAAHKRLMQKVHPDKGGSPALAAQINQAKKVLLGRE